MKNAILIGFAAVALCGSVFVRPADADWALAVSQQGAKHWAYGSSWNDNDVQTARRRALANCDGHGPNCKVVLDGSGGCVALAVGLSDNAWHANSARSRRIAAQTALTECVKSSAGDCEVRNSFCEE